MDKSLETAYKSKIKTLKKQLKHRYSESVNAELEVIEDDYEWLRTDKGWAQYQASKNKGGIQ